MRDDFGLRISDFGFLRRQSRCSPKSEFRIPKSAMVFLLVLFLLPLHAQTPSIVQIDLDDIVHPISAEYVRAGLNHARDSGARAVILRINTPGGLEDSMREMVEAILTSSVPVITWVGPNGSRAASAGFFVLLAGDVAAMAPGTNTGAAHPVSMTGGQIEGVMEKKVINDATAFLRSYVTRRDRNPVVAELAVTDSKSFTAQEALQEHLIDAVVNDIPEIIRQYNGKEVRRFDEQHVRLNLDGAAVEKFEMTFREKVLSQVLNPNLALVLALIGLAGLYFEMTHPGLILPGVAGAISLILALYAFNLLPVSWAGVALIVLAIALFVIEATVVSHGILAVGGIVAMIAGGLMLVQGPIPQLRIQLATMLALSIPFALITVFLVRLVVVSRHRKSVTGESGMIGEVGVAKSDVHDDGKVFVHGEYWNAFSTTPIPNGAPIRVVKVQGLKLKVEPDRRHS
jgi:membrane-bound serine protease (ClpP class)